MKPNRFQRRRSAAIARTVIKKKSPFGRIVALSFDSGPNPQDDRFVYRHLTKGVVDRRMTDQLMFSLAA